jgi:hypothetical protein
MYFEVAKSSGRTYTETVRAGTAKVREHRKGVTVWFKGSEKSKGEFTIAKNEAERLAHALLLACSTEDTVVQFPFGEAAKT